MLKPEWRYVPAGDLQKCTKRSQFDHRFRQAPTCPVRRSRIGETKRDAIDHGKRGEPEGAGALKGRIFFRVAPFSSKPLHSAGWVAGSAAGAVVGAATDGGVRP